MKTVFAALLAVLVAVSFNGWSEEANQNAKPLADVKKEIAEGKAVIVDVREKSEWDAGHVKDAKFLPLSELKAGKSDLTALPKDKTIYTYCAVGVRSLKAAGILKEKGFPAMSLKEGFGALTKGGFEASK